MKIFPPIFSGLLFSGLLLGASISTLSAQDSDSGLPSAAMATAWTGITFKVMEIRHILQNRLLVVVKIEATKDAPTAGTFLGTTFVIPASLAKKPWLWDAYDPKPFTLFGATMTDELSNAQFPTLNPVYPPAMRYFPADTKETFRPGGYEFLSLQFATPPPPPPPTPGQPPKPQTLTFIFPKAAGPIAHVPLPPPEKTP